MIDENKSDLVCLLSKEIERTQVSRKILVSTCSDSVVSSSTEVDLNNMSGCTHEEADTRAFLHVAGCVKQGQKAILPTADTDVVVLAISVVEKIKVEEMWAVFGTGNISDALQPTGLLQVLVQTNQGLCLSFTLYDCDTVSFFDWEGRLKA